MEQRTEEWYKARMGQLGASRIADVMAKGKGSAESASRKNLRAELVAMRLSGESPEGFMSAAMQWGVDNEPLAVETYEAINMTVVELVGFIPHPSIQWTGASPDGMVGDEGLIEIKCPNTATHIEYKIKGEPPRQYLLQMQWQMECTGRDWCDFMSYDPRLPGKHGYFIKRIPRDDKLIAEIRAEVIKFLAEVEQTIKTLEDME